jgi:hypothetical protein
VVTWIDLNAVFYPDYATSYPTIPAADHRSTASVSRLAQLTGRDLGRQFNHGRNQGPLVSFDRPELSPILADFDDRNDPAYLEALEIIRAGQAQLAERPDVGMEGFQLSGIDLWRENKYQAATADRSVVPRGDPQRPEAVRWRPNQIRHLLVCRSFGQMDDDSGGYLDVAAGVDPAESPDSRPAGVGSLFEGGRRGR